MKNAKFHYDFNPEKNLKLKQKRGISFEEIVVALDEGHCLEGREHPNKEKYPHQKIYVVEIENYAYLMPFVENELGTRFLKTIISCRKSTKKHLRH